MWAFMVFQAPQFALSWEGRDVSFPYKSKSQTVQLQEEELLTTSCLNVLSLQDQSPVV